MTERYETVTAFHYAAYRPPLHRMILERVLGSFESFSSGLDFGCGTGYSSVALTHYSNRVCGVDLNQQMLNLTEQHPQITYLLGTVEDLPCLVGQPYDIITFAGSLFYVKSEALRIGLSSVCRPGTTIIVYDFNVLTKELLNDIGFTASLDESDYDHDISIAEWNEFKNLTNESACLAIKVSAEEAAHLLLSDSFYYDALQAYLNLTAPFDALVSMLSKQKDEIQLVVDVFYKRYEFCHIT